MSRLQELLKLKNFRYYFEKNMMSQLAILLENLGFF